jgi:hypothetical protein
LPELSVPVLEPASSTGVDDGGGDCQSASALEDRAAAALDVEEAAGGSGLPDESGLGALSVLGPLLLLLLMVVLAPEMLVLLLLDGVKQTVRLSGCWSGCRPVTLGRYSACSW